MPGKARPVYGEEPGLRFGPRAIGALVAIGLLTTRLASIPPANLADALSLKPAVGVIDFDAPVTAHSAGTVIPQQFAAMTCRIGSRPPRKTGS
jgi:hypothetical protein